MGLRLNQQPEHLRLCFEAARLCRLRGDHSWFESSHDLMWASIIQTIEINVGFCSLGGCRGLMAQEWGSRWSIPPSACTPSPETPARTHRNTCMSWSMGNSQVRLKRCMKFIYGAKYRILTDAGVLMLVHISITSLLLLSIMIIETHIIVKYYLKPFEPLTPLNLAPDLLLDFSRIYAYILQDQYHLSSLSPGLSWWKLLICHR